MNNHSYLPKGTTIRIPGAKIPSLPPHCSAGQIQVRAPLAVENVIYDICAPGPSTITATRTEDGVSIIAGGVDVTALPDLIEQYILLPGRKEEPHIPLLFL